MPQLYSCLHSIHANSHDYYFCINEHMKARMVLHVPILAHYEIA
jgi:hypothetical protein